MEVGPFVWSVPISTARANSVLMFHVYFFHLFYDNSRFLDHFLAIGELKLELKSGNV